MAAVLGLEPEVVARVCAEAAGEQVVSPANYNGPSQVVIAGHADAVARASEAARTAGARRVVALDVSAPFHCELMRPAAERLRPVLERLHFSRPTFPVFSNVEAAPLQDGASARTALLRQVASPVRWHESIEALLAAGIETFVEVGPGKVLAGLVRAIRRDARVIGAGDRAGIETAVAELG
jgi:[acyl-carrier-protein] S-malonyltransferase